MADLGAPEPESWARSEVAENIAQQARYLVLRAIWPQLIDRFGQEQVIRSIPAAQRLLDGGASLTDVAKAMRAVAYETAFEVLARLDEGHDVDAPADAPGWILMETRPDGSLTGRNVGGLHESLLSLDPRGSEGEELRL